ncbi:MAG: glucose-1-phosphate adenylyltransferase [Armatimonadetes bacterium]|nr:glucose-1-phosphate adenylyltransferase [Armatimonadota bacterium]
MRQSSVGSDRCAIVASHAIVMVLAGGQGQRLYPLTVRRAKPALRFGGAYRMIDFTLSNCLNSGLRRIYVLAQYAATSLMRHLRRGWTPLLSDALGEYIEVLPPQQVSSDRWYAGTADAVYQNLRLLQEERPEVVVLLSGDHAYKMDYRRMLEFHVEREAALTIAALAVPVEKARQLGVMGIDEDGRVVDFAEKPAEPRTIPGRPDQALSNMGVYIWDTRTLAEWIARDARQESEHDFGKNLLPAMVEAREAVYAYEFLDPRTGGPAYWRDIGTLQNYWESHMDLVRVVPEFDLYDPNWPIYTARDHYPPAKTVLGDRSQVVDSLLCEGCIVSGARVERSVLSPGVKVAEGAEVTESILFDRVEVGPGARLHRVIVDEGLRVPAGYQIGLSREEDERRFVVSPEGLTVVPQGAVFH